MAPHPYAGSPAAIASRHRKERAIGPPLAARPGLRIVVPEIDTDAFGTFTGEIERRGTAAETAEAKARAGAESAALPLAVASEGSFGPHPAALGLERFLRRSGFPSHALIVRPADGPPDRVVKGIRSPGMLEVAVRECSDRSPVGRSLVETDMRAHMNPTRILPPLQPLTPPYRQREVVTPALNQPPGPRPWLSSHGP